MAQVGPIGRRLGALLLALAIASCGQGPGDPAIAAPPGPLVARRARSLTVLPGFSERVIFTGLVAPTAMRFSSDGRVFVAEKSGLVKVFPSLTDPEAIVVADLTAEVYDYWDRGLLDIVLDPDFPTRPFLYALYTMDGRVGDSVAAGTVPRFHDACPTQNGTGGCVVAARLVRLTIAGDLAAVNRSEVVLVENWGQEFPSHSIGSLAFGPDGLLYASAGEAASFDQVDYGNLGGNPLHDPPDPVSFAETAPTAMGGALRAQVIRPPAASPPFPTWFNGKVIRIDPRAAEPLVDPSSVPFPAPVIASGLRNPFRMTFRADTRELWIADVGWNAWEEIDRVADVASPGITNFGWPCYEGRDPQGAYQAAGLDLCSTLYASPAAHTRPVFAYYHYDSVVPGDACPIGGSAITGLAFRGQGAYPSDLDGALFFADFARGCIWVMPEGEIGQPDVDRRQPFVVTAGYPVQLVTGPEQDLYYVDFLGTIRRIEFTTGNHPPRAVATAAPALGPLPLVVSFDGSASQDPDPDEVISWAWDLDGDGAFDDGDAPTASFTYRTAGTVTARLRVSDARGASATVEVVVRPGQTAPVPVIDTPGAIAWKTGDEIAFTGHATDAEDGTLPASSLRWSAIVHHCPSDCHEHVLQTFPGVPGGKLVAPSHDYPVHLELRLTATDAGGVSATTSLILQPQTVELTVDSSPPALSLALGGNTGLAPLSATLVVGSSISVSAPSQVAGVEGNRFVGWSDGGAQSHSVIAGPAAARYLALFEPLALTEIKTQAARIVARVTAPRGSGSRNLETIRDGVRPPAGSGDSGQQYDTWDGPNDPAPEDWIGYELGRPFTLARLVMQEGLHFPDGGWWESLAVQVHRGGLWVPVSGLRSTPSYAGNNGVSYETFTLDFEPVVGDGIRLAGRPGGSSSFISLAELDVWAAPPPAGHDHAPLASAGADVVADAGTLVALDGSASSDLDGDSLGYSWSQTGGPPITLTGAATVAPTFIAPLVGTPSDLIFAVTVSDGLSTSEPDAVVVTVVPPPGRNVSAAGRIIARVPEPGGSGSRTLETIRDGDKPPPGTIDSLRQFDTFIGDGSATQDWIGYELPQIHTFSRLVFQEGMHFFDGGWFDGLEVQVRRDGVWTAVPNLRVRPAYPGNNGIGYETFQLHFEQQSGDAIRIFGQPGGPARFISVGELEAYGTPLAGDPPVGPDLTAAGAIIARVTAPTGSGSRNIEIIRDGDLPALAGAANQRQYDTYTGTTPAARDWIGYQFGSSQTFARVVFQEGMQFADGGWFDGLTVQVFRGFFWRTVSGLTITPAYAGADGIHFNTYRLDFAPTAGTAIRVIGTPGGSSGFISVGELRVFAPAP
jgi:glucose/arabinose dehydrogenase/PKD repeat protein